MKKNSEIVEVQNNIIISDQPIIRALQELSQEYDRSFFDKQCSINSVLKGSVIGLGAASGLPWINSAYASGRGHKSLGALIVISMLVAYGTTTAWAGKNIIKSATFKIPSTYEEFIEKNRKNRHIAEHLLLHILGALTVIPSAYIAFVFNDNRYIYLPLVIIVQYLFNTFSLYQLSNNVIKPFFKSINCYRENSIYLNEIVLKREMLHKIFDYLNAECHSNVIDLDNLDRYLTENEVIANCLIIIKHIQENEHSYWQSNPALIKIILRYMALAAVDIIFPTVNILTYSVMSYNSLQAIYPNDIFCFSLLPFIIGPLYSLDLYAIHYGSNSILQTFLGHASNPSITKETYKILYYAVLLIGLCLSGLSSLNNQYVSEEQLATSIFSEYALTLSLSIFITTLALESLGLGHSLIEIFDLFLSWKEPVSQVKSNASTQIKKLKEGSSYLPDDKVSGFIAELSRAEISSECSYENAAKKILRCRQSFIGSSLEPTEGNGENSEDQYLGNTDVPQEICYFTMC